MRKSLWTLVGTMAMAGLMSACQTQGPIDVNDGTWEKVWGDEFAENGAPDPAKWSFEKGYVRNRELQWYQPENAICKDGLLVIEGRQDFKRNPLFNPGNKDWRSDREFIEYTSASVKTQGKFEFLYGCVEVRARIPVDKGAWPAIWTLGTQRPWPHCGEIDIMEFYRVRNSPSLLANVAHGGDAPGKAIWFTKIVPLMKYRVDNLDWPRQFHVWRMDWTPEFIKLYLDGELLNEVSIEQTVNTLPNDPFNPFRSPQYLLLNLAIGASGGEPDLSFFPLRYEIDYVRIYQKKK